MRKNKRFFIISFLLVLLLAITGCSSNLEKVKKDSSSDDKNIKGETLNVVTSIYPVYDFTKKIAGDKVNISLIIPAGMHSHSWEPSPKDMAILQEADLFIYNGAGMEYWVEDVLNSVNNEGLNVLDTSKGIELIKLEEEHEKHEEHEEHEEHEDHEDHEHHEGDGHNHGEYDPHIWLSPKNAVIQMKNIKDVLQEMDEKNKDYYEKNYEENKLKLEKLDESFKKTSENFSTHDIIVSHEAFAYIGKEYNLNQIGISGVFAEGEPDLAKMKEIVDYIRKNNVKAVYYESSDSKKVAESVAKEANIISLPLNPIENLTKEEFDSGEDYISMMEKNLESLEKGLN